jgi:hypothetical protein
MKTTAVAGSTTLASTIVPTSAKPRPATPLTVPASRTVAATNTTSGVPSPSIIWLVVSR